MLSTVRKLKTVNINWTDNGVFVAEKEALLVLKK